jgi:heme-degrading monooxygenase HmoA
MVESTLRRISTVTDPAEFEKRREALAARLLPHLQRQPGFVSHDLQRDGDGGGQVEVTVWRSAGDCRSYLRNGAAATAATWLDAFFPTAPFPNGNWVRETVERA